MFASLHELIPGFQVDPKDLPRENFSMILEESTFQSGEFVTMSVLEAYLHSDRKVIFIAANNSYAHYLAVLKKLVRKSNHPFAKKPSSICPFILFCLFLSFRE